MLIVLKQSHVEEMQRENFKELKIKWILLYLKKLELWQDEP
jgi:hypothetical protein